MVIKIIPTLKIMIMFFKAVPKYQNMFLITKHFPLTFHFSITDALSLLKCPSSSTNGTPQDATILKIFTFQLLDGESNHQLRLCFLLVQTIY